MALPARHDINEAHIDARVRRVFRWLVDGEPADLTDWTARLRIGKGGRLVVELDDAITLGGADGTVTLDVPAGTLTSTGTYRYVVDLIDPNGEPTWFVGGYLRMLGVFS